MENRSRKLATSVICDFSWFLRGMSSSLPIRFHISGSGICTDW
jgi:hypothetical protein